MGGNERLRQAINEAGHSQESFAHKIGVHPKQVGRWVSEGVVPFLRNQRAAAAELAAATGRDIDNRHLWPPAPMLAPVGTVEGVDRRRFVGGSSALAAGALVAPTQVFASPADVPPELAGYFADQLVGHYAADTRLGARPLLAIVTTEYGLIRQAADAAKPALRGDLLGAGFGYAELAGWLYQDVGDLAASRRWYGEALELAHRRRSPNLVGFALARMAFLHGDAGDAANAVDLADAALAVPGASGAAQVYALSRAARARAMVGDREGVDQALDDYQGALVRSHDDSEQGIPHWGTPSLVTAHDAQRAICYGRLGRSAEAADLWETVLDQHPSEARRDRGMALAHYATALLDVEGPRAALGPAVEAVECHETAGSARVRRELVTLRDRASACHHDGARDLHEALQAV